MVPICTIRSIVLVYYGSYLYYMLDWASVPASFLYYILFSAGVLWFLFLLYSVLCQCTMVPICTICCIVYCTIVYISTICCNELVYLLPFCTICCILLLYYGSYLYYMFYCASLLWFLFVLYVVLWFVLWFLFVLYAGLS